MKSSDLPSKKAQKILHKIYYGIGKPGALSRDPKRIYPIFKRKNPTLKITLKKLTNWLSLQEPNALHKNARRIYPRNPVFVPSQFYQFATDLIDISWAKKNNKGYRYILVVIDSFSRYVWCEPLKTKTGLEVSRALEKIFKSLKKTPYVLTTDHGTEFFNRDTNKIYKKFNIKIFGSHGVTKNSIAERFNRTVQEKLQQWWTKKRDRNWLAILPKIVQTYNTSYHSSISMSPAEVNDKTSFVVYNKLYGKYIKGSKKKPKFKNGDLVRLNMLRPDFSKKFEQKWSRQLFEIVGKPYFTNMGHLPMYKLRDLAGEFLPSRFYETEISLADRSTYLDKFKFPYEHIGKPTKKGQKISYIGWPSKFNTYISKKSPRR